VDGLWPVPLPETRIVLLLPGRLGIRSATDILGNACGTSARMQLPAKSRVVFTEHFARSNPRALQWGPHPADEEVS